MLLKIGLTSGFIAFCFASAAIVDIARGCGCRSWPTERGSLNEYENHGSE